ncbi:DNA cytosine methyltransferase [Streptomyces sp. FH025]|uniref:DNA cytosine methyltransferase n=1 Tax=Streptomyces sp. FH025 TaxID=2815937 RepID=UPI001A9D759F|nr:DNA cytosine methyltransferase [Streptomyces sp. FH025]MBO1414618.1 DNA cytosine methyltransferase [Streptomyces sp. FH025]
MVDQPEETKKPRTSVELFAGGGGLAMAVHQAGYRPLLFNEFNSRACETLEASARKTLGEFGIERTDSKKPRPPAIGEPAPLSPRDVVDLDLTAFAGQVDVLAGGPPCQPFSAGGVAKGDEDKRNMFPAMFKAIREMRPKVVICENVRGLLRPSFEEYFKYIQRELTLPFEERVDKDPWQYHNEKLKGIIDRLSEDDENAEHYRVRVFKVNAADYGVPQIRNRVVMVAFRADLPIDADEFFEEHSKRRFSKEALLLSMRDEDGAYWRRHDHVKPHVRDKARGGIDKKVRPRDGEEELPAWRTLRDAIQGYGTDVRLPALPEIDLNRLDRKTEQAAHLGITGHIGWPAARIYKGHTPNELDLPAKTVKAGVHGVPGGESVMLLDDREPDSKSADGYTHLHRYMTVRETARVMTFPDEWVGCGPRGEQMRQLGNAVPVVLGEYFANAVSKALDDAGE